MKASELIQALEEGKTLDKDYAIAFPDQYKYTELGENVERINMYEHNGRKYFNRFGWGSALGKESDVIMEIIINPERWSISTETPTP